MATRRRKSNKKVETATGEIVSESYCRKCMKTKRTDFFYQALNFYIDRNGLDSICKDCHYDIYSDLLKEYKNIPDTLLKYCQVVNIVFNETIVIEIKDIIIKQDDEGKKKKHPVAMYNQRIKTLNRERDTSGKFYSLDLTFSQEVYRIYRDELDDTSLVPNDFWGDFYTEDQLNWLDSQYGKFKDTISIDIHPEVMLLKQVCKKMLYIEQAERENDLTTVGKLEIQLQAIMKSLGISPATMKSARSGGLKSSFGQFIEMIEKNEPASWLETEAPPLFGDESEIMRSYWEALIARPARNFIYGESNFTTVDKNTGEVVETEI